MKKQTCYIPERRGKVGGQAVLEGVMMKSGDRVALTVRKDDGTMETKNSTFVSAKTKHPICNLPIIRGVVSFVESLILSFSTLNDSAEMLGIDEELNEPKKKNADGTDKKSHTLDILMLVATVLGIALAIFLFMFLPTFFTKIIVRFTGDLGLWQSVIEGVIKIGIFVAYMLLVSLMKDIRRTFEYHGAEHKSIFCYEAGKELTVENVREQSRFHPRCGTSFMFVMLGISIFSGLFITWENMIVRVLLKLLLLPLVMGVGYEFLMYAGKHDNAFVRILSAPGLWMQRITTREPDDAQIECAIASLKAAMPEEFPPESKMEETADETNDSTEEK
ncbi:MAG: DUF1385 domain-containing protein [Clostridia bacterium]|nr:DUF1385 domain-containing protein [Clostridia bacterium]